MEPVYVVLIIVQVVTLLIVHFQPKWLEKLIRNKRYTIKLCLPVKFKGEEAPYLSKEVEFRALSTGDALQYCTFLINELVTSDNKPKDIDVNIDITSWDVDMRSDRFSFSQDGRIFLTCQATRANR